MWLKSHALLQRRRSIRAKSSVNSNADTSYSSSFSSGCLMIRYFLIKSIVLVGLMSPDALVVDAYLKSAKIADHQTSVQIVVGKSVAAGIVLINLPFPLVGNRV